MKNSLFLIAVLCGLVLSLAGCHRSENHLTSSDLKIDLPVGRAIGQAELQMSGDFPKVPDKVKVYKVVPPVVTLETVTAIGKRLGLTGPATLTDAGLFYMSGVDNETELMVHLASGAIHYYNLSYDKYVLKNSLLVPSNEEATTIATDYLKQEGLLFPDTKFNTVGEGDVANGIIITRIVGFKRMIDGMPALGTGAHHGVRVGVKGEIVEIMVNHPDFEFYQDISIRPPSQAFEDLKANGGTQLFKQNSTKVLIDEVLLGYWMNPIVEKQDFLLPIYQFKGKCYDAQNKLLGDFTGWTEAAVTPK